MSAQELALVGVSALFTVAANLLLRAGLLHAGGLTLASGWELLGLLAQPLFAAGLVFYGLAAMVWFRVLSVAQVSTSYPLLVSLTFLLVTLGAMFFFHEQVSLQKALGMGVILLGFFLVARG